MSNTNLIFRLHAFLHHRLTSRHTMGYSIHSPYLFYLARFILPETKPYYCFKRLEKQRITWLRSADEVFVEDFGTGSSGKRKVSALAETSLKSRVEAQLLMRLCVENRVQRVLELGTSLGLTTAYLASASSAAEVVTMEGAPELVRLARKSWQQLGLKNIHPVVGNIDETLPKWIAEKQQLWHDEGVGKVLDFCFMDANHTGEATLRYFRWLQPLAGPRTIYVLDDIHRSPDMQEAWNTIRQLPGVTATFDLYSMGLVFFDPHLERRTYRIRL